ncbi:hypothetical protein UY3_14834 [Chelonia mydas]|uniref:Uncharacterized protein n=1 Tax=Chelonia mydas TaxID=8469 RepID=M7ARU8_CHEMY|nr:hypothetical protein UY3_14834 [Chelonia mydas]
MAATAKLVAVDAREAAASKTEPLSADSLIGLGREAPMIATDHPGSYLGSPHPIFGGIKILLPSLTPQTEGLLAPKRQQIRLTGIDDAETMAPMDTVANVNPGLIESILDLDVTISAASTKQIKWTIQIQDCHPKHLLGLLVPGAGPGSKHLRSGAKPAQLHYLGRDADIPTGILLQDQFHLGLIICCPPPWVKQ